MAGKRGKSPSIVLSQVRTTGILFESIRQVRSKLLTPERNPCYFLEWAARLECRAAIGTSLSGYEHSNQMGRIIL